MWPSRCVLINPWLALLSLAPLPLLLISVRRTGRKLRTVTRQQRRKEGDAASFAAESLRQVRVVKAYGAEDRATEQFARDARSGERASVKAARLAGRMSLFTEGLTGAGTALVLLAGAWQVQQGSLTPGELLVVTSYARMLYKPLRKVSTEGGRLSKAVACAGRLTDVLEQPVESSDGRPAPEFEGSLRLVAVGHHYPNGTRTLSRISFALKPGTFALLSGPNGAGKSTLLSVVLRLLQPDRGLVLVDGQPANAFELISYRSRFAFVPQDLLLFGSTIRENIQFGRPDATDEQIEAAARLALFDDVAQSLPDGYDTALGEGGCTLSGGQARRLMLARAAVRDAPFLILDEPLAGLDVEARPHVAKAIRRLARGRTTIVVTHEGAAELDADVELHLEGGLLVEGGRATAGDHTRPLHAVRPLREATA